MEPDNVIMMNGEQVNSVPKEKFDKTVLKRTIIKIVHNQNTNKMEMECGPGVTYGDVLFGFLCWCDSLIKSQPKVGSIDKILGDIDHMWKTHMAPEEKEVK